MFKLLYFLFLSTLFLGTSSYSNIEIKARTAIVQDFLSGEILYEKDPDKDIYPASMTKIMTSIIAFDLIESGDLNLDDKFIVSEKAWRLSTAGYSSMFVMVGDEVSVENLLKIEGIEEETAKALVERAKEFHQKDQEDISQRIKELGLEEGLINLKGLTPGMLVTLGDQKILSLKDFADLASDELTGGYDVVKGERVKIQGYLEDFALSKEEADGLIMSARNIVYKD